MADGSFRVVVTDQVFPDVEIERAILADKLGAELVVAQSREEALALAADADALLNTYLPLDAEALRGLTRCRIVARYGIGVDNIDLEAARAAGIVVTNVPDYCVEEVATHAAAMALAVIRKLPQSDAAMRRGEWGVGPVRPLPRLSELTVGVVGFGRIARHFARLMSGFGASIIFYDPYVPEQPGTRKVELEDLLASADIVSLHSPLTPETRGMISASTLALMPSHAVLVNTSRGPLVVLDDLLAALREGRLAGAALDVFETEPPDHTVFEGVPNLLVSPHTAFYSEAAVRESQTKAATQIVKVLTGEAADYQVN